MMMGICGEIGESENGWEWEWKSVIEEDECEGCDGFSIMGKGNCSGMMN